MPLLFSGGRGDSVLGRQCKKSLEKQLLRKRLSHLSQCMTWTLDRWRIPLLDKLLATSENMEYMGMEEKEVSRMIDSLCIN